MQTKEQQRSEFALKQVQEIFGVPVKKDDANFVVGVPTMILTNGLGQTLAFLLSKGKPQHTGTFRAVQSWLGREMPDLATAQEMNFLQKLAAADQRDYLRAQREALAMLEWLKRYARAFQADKDKEQS